MESEISFNENIKNIVIDPEISGPLKISVITVCATVSSKLDLDYLFKTLRNFDINLPENILNDTYFLDIAEEYRNPFHNLSIDYNPTNKKNSKVEIITSTKTKVSKTKVKTSFYNCLKMSFTFQETNNISCKIFPNGLLHITGSKTIEVAHAIPQLLYQFINNNQPAIKEPELFQLKDQRIVMINTNFALKVSSKESLMSLKLNQELFKNILNTNYSISNGGCIRLATFYPEQYPGINIKFWTKKALLQYKEHLATSKKIPKNKIDGQISIFIFKSGKISITAAKNSADLEEAYKGIIEIIRKHPEIFIT